MKQNDKTVYVIVLSMVGIVLLLVGLSAAFSYFGRVDAHNWSEPLQCSKSCKDAVVSVNSGDTVPVYSTCMNYCAKLYIDQDVLIPTMTVAAPTK